MKIDSYPIQCPVCASMITSSSSLRHHWGDQRFDLYLCEFCQLRFWYPLLMPTELFYESDAENLSAPVRARHTFGSQRLGDNHQRFFENHVAPGKRLLDIGCGDGHFLAEAQQRGFMVSGLDLDSKALEVAKMRGIQNLFYGNLDDYIKQSDGSNSFDIVTFFEVLEHQAAPLNFMANVKKLLRPGGWIVGSVPNVNRLISARLNTSDRPPYHFTQWSVVSILNMLRRQGFKEILVLPVGTGYYTHALLYKLNLSAKEQLLNQVDSISLAAFPVDVAAQRAGISGGRLEIIKGLRGLKALALSPLVALETLVEKIWQKGQYLYFEGRM